MAVRREGSDTGHLTLKATKSFGLPVRRGSAPGKACWPGE